MTTDGDSENDDHDAEDAHDAEERHVVTAFLRNAGEVLLIRRSDEVGTYAGLWGGVSGYAEGDPAAAARWEIDEEVGLADAVTFVRAGDPVAFTDPDLDTRWVVHPYLFDCTERAVEPNREIRETVWIAPPEILRRETVPELWTAYDRVRPTVETVTADTEHGSAYLSIRALEALRDEAGLRAVVRERGASVDDANERDADTDERGEDWPALVETAERLLDARPSMTALVNRVNRAMTTARAEAETATAVERAAHAGVERALDADRRAAAVTAERVAGETVLTLSRSGTVERALSGTAESDRRDTAGPAGVYVAESRPAREGVGVAERLASDGREVTLVTDAAVAHVLGRDVVDRVVVGADTVLPDGRVLNKTGTRGAAIAAANEGVPVDAVASADKVSATETVAGEEGPAEAVYDGDADLRVENPTFDLTPAGFVTRVVTERGVLDADGVADVADEHRALTGWRE
ncbi:NUDIX domain-containing protein [Salinigranum sp. GCM10025319]|uniref:NUDIX domain-containing protein n=1 Tax=Salinigranum sp. GCM10025319 TaxID=3252687 RepID=UPI00361AE281